MKEWKYERQSGVPFLLSHLAVVLLFVLAAGPAQAQERTLIGRYQAARFEVLVERLLEEQGWRAPVAAPVPLSTPLTDSLRALLVSGSKTTKKTEADESLFSIHSVHAIRRPERAWFKQHFAGVDWAYLGHVGLVPLDTMHTRRLRARMQAHFGPPSLKLADIIGRPEVLGNGVSQFEYWFVINESIPVKVMNAGTPLGRGIILVAPTRYRRRLEALRRALLGRLVHSDRRAPFVDYYYHAASGRFYRTGFDGEEYFLKPIRRSTVVPGRRPRLKDPA